MYYFSPDKLPVLTTLAKEFAVFNRWFASIPGPTLCNRAFAHYGTSFGHVSMEIFYAGSQYKSVYERLLAANISSHVYYFDVASSALAVPNLLTNQPQLFGTFNDFVDDCAHDRLPSYSFIEPNYTDHDDASGAMWIASDQHPDHHVREGERFIATVYNALRKNPVLWPKSALLVLYDEHGGTYDHVEPPSVVTDGFVAQPAATGTGDPFYFDRLGVRVPAVLISPWIPKGTVVNGRIFEHASIPATATDWLIGLYNDRSPREKNAETFLDLLTAPAARTDCIEFQL
jgi:phospholipase C